MTAIEASAGIPSGEAPAELRPAPLPASPDADRSADPRDLPIALAVISRYPSVRAGLRVLLDSGRQRQVIAEAASLELLNSQQNPGVDVVVVDLGGGPELDGLIESVAAETGLVLLGADQTTVRAIGQPHPMALLRRDAGRSELTAAVTAVHAGLTVLDPALASAIFTLEGLRLTPSGGGPVEELTPRELEVLQLLVEGIPNKAIALRLGISDHTVKFHVGAVLSKLGAASRTEAVRLAARFGLVAL